MKAVNLVPSDLRRAGSGGGSGSGTGAYIVLGVLAAAVLIVAVVALSTRQVRDRQAEVTRLNAEAQAAEQQAASLSSYGAVVSAANTRRGSVVKTIQGRFDWAGALRDVSRTVPDGVSLTTMDATVAPGLGDAGSGSPLRAAVAAPAIEITGCTPSQDATAALMSRLRSMKGVTKVGLSSSAKDDSQGSGGSVSGGATSDCTGGSKERPRVNLVVFYGDSAATAAATDTTTTASTTTTTPTPGSSK